jgi:hypothetical protein
VDGPVAADDDEQAGAVIGRLPREIAELARPIREDRLSAEPRSVGGPRELGPPLPRLPVRRRRVDEEDRLAGQG